MKKILVTGATGKTGSLVIEKLKQLKDEFIVIGLARSPQKLQEKFGNTDGFHVGDITNPETLSTPLSGCQGLVILTSAKPIMKGQPAPGERPEFEFAPGGMPEAVDWLGQKNQIDTAKAAGVEHIVLVGSMGSTDPNHYLNSIGNGNILVWKRKAEEYLIDSGVDYTIINPGGLLDEPGGKRELIAGKGDRLLFSPPEEIPPSIPRADVAEVVVQALRIAAARNKAFDLISFPESHPNSQVTTDFTNLFAQTTPGL